MITKSLVVPKKLKAKKKKENHKNKLEKQKNILKKKPKEITVITIICNFVHTKTV